MTVSHDQLRALVEDFAGQTAETGLRLSPVYSHAAREERGTSIRVGYQAEVRRLKESGANPVDLWFPDRCAHIRVTEADNVFNYTDVDQLVAELAAFHGPEFGSETPDDWVTGEQTTQHSEAVHLERTPTGIDLRLYRFGLYRRPDPASMRVFALHHDRPAGYGESLALEYIVNPPDDVADRPLRKIVHDGGGYASRAELELPVPLDEIERHARLLIGDRGGYDLPAGQTPAVWQPLNPVGPMHNYWCGLPTIQVKLRASDAAALRPIAERLLAATETPIQINYHASGEFAHPGQILYNDQVSTALRRRLSDMRAEPAPTRRAVDLRRPKTYYQGPAWRPGR